MAAMRTAVFLDQLRECQLLERSQLDDLSRSSISKSDDSALIARELVQKKWLTSFQVTQLLQGKGTELRVGPYRLLDRLGEGGMGFVYKAYHQQMGRTVALKVIRKEKLNNAIAIRRFQQEIRVISQLSHPNIVTAFDAGQAGENQYFAMEYVEGVDLARMVKKNGPLPLSEACDYVRQAALGLQHAQEHGLVHRDIKPGNLMLANKGSIIKILDMGLVRLESPSEAVSNGITQVGTVVGTPDYLAPEQAKDSRTVDIRADLYSLGCSLYYLLVGQPPFKAQSLPEVLLKHQTEPPPAVEVYRPDVPMGVQTIIRKLLAKRPEERYQTPAELAAALLPYTKKSDGSVKKGVYKEASAIVRRSSRKSSKRKPRRTMFAAVALLLLGALLGLGAAAYSGLIPLHRGDTSSAIVEATKGETKNKATVPTQPKLDTKAKTDDPKPKTEDPKPKTEDPKPKTEDPKPKTEDPKPKTEDPKPKTEDPKPKTEDPKPKLVNGKFLVPEDAKYQENRKKLRESYKEEYAKVGYREEKATFEPTQKQQALMVPLANKLRDEAIKAKDDPLTGYSLFHEAGELASHAGNLDLVLKIVDDIDERYVYNAADVKKKMLDQASKSPVLPAMKQITQRSVELAEQRILKGDYEQAAELLKIATVSANKAKDPPLLASIQARARDITDIANEAKTAQLAFEVLKTKPDDPEANLRWGKFQAFYQGDWKEGIEHLAKGSDAGLKLKAREELTKPSSSTAQMELGDYWFEQAEKSHGLVKKNQLLHAEFWYKQCVKELAGFNRFKVDKKLTKEIPDLIKKEGPVVEKPPAPDPQPPPFPENTPSWDAHRDWGLYYLNVVKDYKKAVQHLTVALEMKPGDPTTMNARNRAIRLLKEKPQ
jgi:serine/threonine protein kinase